MNMEELNKTQIVLLTLLISFVTSIATGIVTVTLMDQAPPGVTQTINRVVEKTVKIIIPERLQGAEVAQTIIIKEEDFIIDATKKNENNVVKIGFVQENEDLDVVFTATGFVVSTDGLIVTDKALVLDIGNLIIETLNKEQYRVKIIDTSDEHLALLQVEDLETTQSADDTEEKGIFSGEVLFYPVTLLESDEIHIGQTAIALGREDGLHLSLGIISFLLKVPSSEDDTLEVLQSIHTTIDRDMKYRGGPVLSTNGSLIGISLLTRSGEYFVVPAYKIAELIDEYNREKEQED